MMHRDPSAWYHLVCTMDTTDSTQADRMKWYINGERLTDFSDAAEVTSINYDGVINLDTEHTIGVNRLYANKVDGYMAEMHFIDGTALTPTSFGESGDYGEWKPIKVSGLTYGTNGFYLDFSDSAALGDDAAGSNDWTVVGLTAVDQMLDTPTNNFCTWNTAEPTPTGVFTEGNTHFQASAINTAGAVAGTIGFSGKFYWEVFSSSTNQYHTEKVGIAADGFALNQYIGYESITWGYGSNGSSQYKIHATTATLLGSRQIGDIQMIAVDTDAGKVWFGRNGTWEESGNPATGANAQYTNVPSVVRPATSVNSTELGTDGSIINCGQDSSFAGAKTAQGNQDGNDIGDFYYTPPTGYLALCTSNLPAVAVVPSEHFSTLLYTGNGVSGRAMTGVGFQPDMLWTKSRSTAYRHAISDVLTGATNTLCTNSNAAVSTDDVFDSFDSDGFTLGNDDASNFDTKTYVAWNWKAGGSGVANTAGTRAAVVSANTDAGFSITTWTGDEGADDSVGHGLSKAPELIIAKSRSEAYSWAIYHHTLGNNKRMQLNSGDAVATDTDVWAETTPTATVFSIGTDLEVNWDTRTYGAYCFHSVDGFSKVGSYTGNGNADGVFIYTGFRPAYVLIKGDFGEVWTIHDTDRSSYNVAKETLFASSTGIEETGGVNYIDLLSNGFKIRTSDYRHNKNTGGYIYLAFAETPFKYSNAR